MERGTPRSFGHCGRDGENAAHPFYGRLGSGGIEEAARGAGSPRKPSAASEYRTAAISRSAFIPMISDRFSRRPPTTAPSMLAPRAAAGESVERNAEANKR